MATTQFNLREDILAMIQQMDVDLLQRVKEVVTVIIDSSSEEEEELSEEDMKNIQEGLDDIKAGRYKLLDDVFKKYNAC